MDKLPTTVGIEFTFVPYEKYIDVDKIGDDMRSHRSIPYNWVRKGYEEAGAIEVPSPICRTWEQIRQRWDEVMILKDIFPIKPQSRIESSGGGHIHLGIPKKLNKYQRKRFFANLINFASEYPCINWGFNEPIDNINANSPLFETVTWAIYSDDEIAKSSIKVRKQKEAHNKKVRTLADKHNITYTSNWYNNHEYHIPFPYAMKLDPHNSRGYRNMSIACRTAMNTIEFRLFDMPDKWNVLRLHIETALAIWQHCLDKALRKEIISITLTPDTTKCMRRDAAKKRFTEVLKILNISKSRCRKQFKNLEERFDMGREFIK